MTMKHELEETACELYKSEEPGIVRKLMANAMEGRIYA